MNHEPCAPASTAISLHCSSVTLLSRHWRADQVHTISSTATSFNNGSPLPTSEYLWIAWILLVMNFSVTSKSWSRTSMRLLISRLVHVANVTATPTNALTAPEWTLRERRSASASTTPTVPTARSACLSTTTHHGDVPHRKLPTNASPATATDTPTSATLTEAFTTQLATVGIALTVQRTATARTASVARRTFTCAKTDIARTATATQQGHDHCNVIRKGSVSVRRALVAISATVARRITSISEITAANLATATSMDPTTTRHRATLKMDSVLARRMSKVVTAASANRDSSISTLTTSTAARHASAMATRLNVKVPLVTRLCQRFLTSTRTRKSGRQLMSGTSLSNRSTTLQGRALASAAPDMRTSISTLPIASWAINGLPTIGCWNSSCSWSINVDRIHRKVTLFWRVLAQEFRCRFSHKVKECLKKAWRNTFSACTRTPTTLGNPASRLVSSCQSWATWQRSRSVLATLMAVKRSSMTLNCIQPTVAQPETQRSGSNSVNALKDMSASSASLAHQDTVTAQPTEGRSCLASLATATNTRKFATQKLVDAFANTTRVVITATNVHEASTEML